MNKKGEILFQNNGAMIFNGKGGQWNVMDSKTLVIRFGNRDRTLKFNDNGSEAVLINPVKNPPSRMRP